MARRRPIPIITDKEEEMVSSLPQEIEELYNELSQRRKTYSYLVYQNKMTPRQKARKIALIRNAIRRLERLQAPTLM